jgi:threonine dehydrogenase-like Zn-dependent dehydrogenase
MKEYVLTGPRTLEYHDYEEQPLKPNEVRVCAIVSGIKHGTEMTLYTGQTPFIEKAFDLDYRMFMPKEGHSLFPLTLGSWLTGEVGEVGCAVTRFKVGDRVHGSMPHRPTNVRAEDELYPLPEGMQPETALFTDPALFALGAVHDAQIKVGDRVAVIGLGALGLLAVQIARLNGAESVFAVDLIDQRLELAKQFGADAVFNPRTSDPALEIRNWTDKKGVDVAIEISGSYAGLQLAIRSIHMGGLIVTASYYKGVGQTLELGAEWHHNAPTIRSSMPVWGNTLRSAPMWDLRRLEATAIKLLASGKLTTEPMIGRRFRYEDAPEAYRFIEAHPEETLKTLLYYDGVPD